MLATGDRKAASGFPHPTGGPNSTQAEGYAPVRKTWAIAKVNRGLSRQLRVAASFQSRSSPPGICSTVSGTVLGPVFASLSTWMSSRTSAQRSRTISFLRHRMGQQLVKFPTGQINGLRGLLTECGEV